MKTNIFFKQIICFLVLTLPLFSLSQELIDISGTIVDQNSKPISGVSITVKGTSIGTQSDLKGNFSLKKVSENATLLFSYVGFTSREVPIDGKNNIIVVFSEDDDGLEEVLVAGYVSPRNYWIGAKIGYNFIGDTDDNFFVGSASIEINLIEGLASGHTFGVIGNIGNFKFNKEGEDNADIKKLAQSINGISVGLGYTHESNKSIFNDNIDFIFRQFIQTGVRLTSFDKIGVNEEIETLAQSASTAGLEMEIPGFKNKGALTLSTGVSLYLFDSNIYQKIFDNKKGSLITLDCTVILPIAEKVGFFMNGTFSKESSAAFIMGIILKP